MTRFNLTHRISPPRTALKSPFTSTYFAKVIEERRNRKNLRLVKDYLERRKKKQAVNTGQLVYLEKQLENKSIDQETYNRLREVLLMSHEMEEFEMLDSVTRQSVKKKQVQN